MMAQTVLYPTNEMDCYDFFMRAWDWCVENGFSEEYHLVENRRFESQTPETFFQEYVWVVLNSGMKNKVAERIYRDFMENRDLNKVGHLGKREAISYVMQHSDVCFRYIQEAKDKIFEIDGLPWIGPITKYHLARNLGIDCAKPDRHLSRLAEKYDFKDVQEMCAYLAERTGSRIGTVDVILWRYCAENGGVE